ncbi:unnamed protein product [Dracunculus medinensis]|uniref:FoP_duplication domain-containing protein n=1 Tax=Dracunculus medinensis TaxID=318479 RepID=A0A0N4UNK7_DRAME|nr:unnamed protein product [Dracunculus medinensis]
MSLIDLSLDEIIARNKSTIKNSGRLMSLNDETINDKNREIRRRGRGFTKQFASIDSAFTKSQNVPLGKWDHSGFEELYGTRNFSEPELLKIGGRLFDRRALSRKELLEDYPIESANVYYDEFGESTGTADVVTDRASAEEIQLNYSGVSVDGSTMHMYLIDENSTIAPSIMPSIKKRLILPRATQSRKTIVHKRLPPRNKNFSNRRRLERNEGKRRQMTDAELDKELEEYMKKKSSNAMEA